MKRLFYNIDRLFIFCMMAVMMLACNKAEDPQYSGETTTIRLKIPQLEARSRVGVAGDEDAINNLRVIILSKNAGSINRLFTSDELPSFTDGGMIMIENVPVGEVQMYVIANEGSLDREYGNLANLQNDVITVPNSENRKVLIKDLERKWFPKRGSEFPVEGLPMSWMNKGLMIESGTVKTIEVGLKRAVAKLNIVMDNVTGHEINIQQVEFGKFFANSLYLFQEINLDVPKDTQYEEQKYAGLDIKVAAGAKETMVCYVYPSFAWTDPNAPSPYELGFSIDSKTYNKKNFTNNGQSLNSIERNTQINIYATLGKPGDLTLSFTVEGWTPKDVEVPDFE